MGGAVSSFAKTVAKAAISGATSTIPLVGGAVGSWINSKFAVGSTELGTIPTGVKIPEDREVKVIKTPAQLKALVKEYPEQAKKAGLTVQMIDESVKEAKEQSMAIGGKVKMSGMVRPMGIAPTPPFGGRVSKAVGDMDLPKEPKEKKEAKPKKPRTEAQKAATKRMLEGLKRHKEMKKHH